jgi:hypothetical protein
MLNLVVKSQNVQPLKLYKDGSNSSLETIRLGSSQVPKGKISFQFRDSESSATSKFIYVLRLGITPLMLKSFISSVRLVNSLY